MSILKVLKKLNKNITKYYESSKTERLKIDITIIEGLLAHPDTKINMHTMTQGRELVIMAINIGYGEYPVKNHIATFEHRFELFKYNHYITNYIKIVPQI